MSSGRVSLKPTAEPLPEVPLHLRICFQKLTELPPGDWTPALVIKIIGKLRGSELRFQKCGQELLIWYDRVKEIYNG